MADEKRLVTYKWLADNMGRKPLGKATVITTSDKLCPIQESMIFYNVTYTPYLLNAAKQKKEQVRITTRDQYIKTENIPFTFSGFLAFERPRALAQADDDSLYIPRTNNSLLHTDENGNMLNIEANNTTTYQVRDILPITELDIVVHCGALNGYQPAAITTLTYDKKISVSQASFTFNSTDLYSVAYDKNMNRILLFGSNGGNNGIYNSSSGRYEYYNHGGVVILDGYTFKAYRPWSYKISNGNIYDSDIDATGDYIYLVGNFTNQTDGTTTYSSNKRIAKLRLLDGKFDTTFMTNIGTGFNNDVWRVKALSNGNVLIAGHFGVFNGTTKNRIIMLSSTGTVVTSFNIGTGINDIVRSLDVDEFNSIIYVGGYFTSYNGSSYNNIIALNYDGSIRTSFDVGTGFDSDVDSLIVLNDGKILCGGKFRKYKGIECSSVVRLLPDGTRDNKVGLYYDDIRPRSNTSFLAKHYVAVTTTVDTGGRTLPVSPISFRRNTYFTSLYGNTHSFPSLDTGLFNVGIHMDSVDSYSFMIPFSGIYRLNSDATISVGYGTSTSTISNGSSWEVYKYNTYFLVNALTNEVLYNLTNTTKNRDVYFEAGTIVTLTIINESEPILNNMARTTPMCVYVAGGDGTILTISNELIGAFDLL